MAVSPDWLLEPESDPLRESTKLMIWLSTRRFLVGFGASCHQIDWVMNNFTNIKTNRVVRGGSWLSYPAALPVTFRSGDTPTNTNEAIGLRCVRAIDYKKGKGATNEL